MAPPLRLCGVQRRARPLAFRIGSPISWSMVLLIPTPPQSAAFTRGFSHSDPACQRYRQTCPPTFASRGGVRGHLRRLTDSGRPRACRGPGGRWRGTTREHSTERSPTLDRAPPPTTHRTTKHRQKIEQESYEPRQIWTQRRRLKCSNLPQYTSKTFQHNVGSHSKTEHLRHPQQVS